MTVMGKNIRAVTVEENVSKFLISIRGAVVVGKIRGQEVRCRKQVKPLTILCRRLATWILKFCKPGATIGKLG